ncbi:MFS transporter [Streptomyces sp.]|uniref:MFS transporter n=1 Tax=Streptomyces sp. TaxID=1931 RepID=UPI002811769B|nr:MFS transporter [Streptomyces sp.]
MTITAPVVLRPGDLLAFLAQGAARSARERVGTSGRHGRHMAVFPPWEACRAMPENTSSTAAAGVHRSGRGRWPVFAVVIAADLLDMIDSTVTTIASPAIVRDLGASDAPVSWLGLSYALALGSLLVIGGRLGDRLGQRRTFLIGLAGFTATRCSAA